jgi:hypothetical protein
VGQNGAPQQQAGESVARSDQKWTIMAQTYHDDECQDPKETFGPVLLKANKAKQAALSDSGCPDSPAQ